jgi:hypothetical protein
MKALTPDEMDLRLQLIQPVQGKVYFKGGITIRGRIRKGQSGLKLMTASAIKNLERHTMPVLDGLPEGFQITVRSLITYYYLGQLDSIPDPLIEDFDKCLDTFHSHREIVHERGYRTTPGWRIPKFELMNSVPSSIRLMGSPQHLTLEAPEALHKPVKKVWRLGSRNDNEEQICKFFNRKETEVLFSDTLQQQVEEAAWTTPESDDDEWETENDDTAGDESLLNFAPLFFSRDTTARRNKKPFTNWFEKALQPKPPPRTFVTQTTAFHLIRRYSEMTLEAAERAYGLCSFRTACAEYFHGSNVVRSSSNQMQVPLHFNLIRVWSYVRVQTKSAQRHGKPNRPVALYAQPPHPHAEDWTDGRYDTCLIANNPLQPAKLPIDMNGMF